MSYQIYSDVLPKRQINTSEEVRIMEAYFKGMKIDYTLVYPSGNEMQVIFTPLNKSKIDLIDSKIEKINKQLDYLEADKRTSTEDKTMLTKHYLQARHILNEAKETLLNTPKT